MSTTLTEQQALILWDWFKETVRKRFIKPEEVKAVKDLILPNIGDEHKYRVSYFLSCHEEFMEWINQD